MFGYSTKKKTTGSVTMVVDSGGRRGGQERLNGRLGSERLDGQLAAGRGGGDGTKGGVEVSLDSTLETRGQDGTVADNNGE